MHSALRVHTKLQICLCKSFTSDKACTCARNWLTGWLHLCVRVWYLARQCIYWAWAVEISKCGAINIAQFMYKIILVVMKHTSLDLHIWREVVMYKIKRLKIKKHFNINGIIIKIKSYKKIIFINIKIKMHWKLQD